MTVLYPIQLRVNKTSDEKLFEDEKEAIAHQEELNSQESIRWWIEEWLGGVLSDDISELLFQALVDGGSVLRPHLDSKFTIKKKEEKE